MLIGSWAVEYTDGTYLTQYDSAGTEVPFRSIEWPRVATLKLESELVAQEFQIIQPPAGYFLALRSRGWVSMVGGGHVQGLMLCLFDGSKPLDPDREQTYIDACVHVMYWLPTGIVHYCPHFNCTEVANYCTKYIHGNVYTLPMYHEIRATVLDANLLA